MTSHCRSLFLPEARGNLRRKVSTERIYILMLQETYVAISISSDLSVLKIYSIVLTFMLPNLGNVTNDGRHIKYLIFVFNNKITVFFCVCLYFINLCLF